jgi:superkiller protein 3
MLVDLAKECLCAEMAGRPRDGGVVAERVTAYLAAVQQRLHAAEVERAAAQARAEEAAKKASAERRARRLTVGLAAAVLLLGLAAGSAAWWWQHQRQAADAALLRGMEDARRTRVQAESDPFGDVALFGAAATTARNVAQMASTSAASAETREQVTKLAEELEQQADAATRDQRLRLALMEVLAPQDAPQPQRNDNGLLRLAESAEERQVREAFRRRRELFPGGEQGEPSEDQQFHEAFLAWGLDVDRMPTQQAAARLRSRPTPFVEEVAAALDQWASLPTQRGKTAARQRKLMALAHAVDKQANSKRRELQAMMARGNLQREGALALLALVLRPVPVPFDAGLGRERTRLRQLVATTDPAHEPVLVLLALVRALRTAGDGAIAEELLRAALRARPQQVLLLHTLGQLLATQQRWQEVVAVHATLRAVRPALGLNLAISLIRVGQVKEGLALFARLRKEQQDNPTVPFYNGVALAKQGRVKEAEEAFRAAIRIKHDFPFAHVNLSNALVQQGRYKEAEAACREAIRLEHDFAQAHVGLGVALSRQSRHRDAEAAFRDAIRFLHDYPLAHRNLGNVLSRQGRYKEAEAACRTAIRLKQDNPSGHCNLGIALVRQGRSKEAEIACREAIRLKPDYPWAHNTLGIALSHQGRHKEAERAFREAIRLEQDFPEAHVNLGTALNNQGRYREAEKACRESIRRKHDDPVGHVNLGAALYGQGRLKEAEAADREAIRLQHGLPEAHCSLGKALLAQRRPKEAENAFREAIHLKHDLPEAHVDLGNALSNQGRHKEAETALREAIRLSHDSPTAHYNLGCVLHDQGRYKEAEESYREATRLKHDYHEAHTNLGLVLESQGRFHEALAAYRKGQELGSKIPGWSSPAATWIRRCRRLLVLDRLLPRILDGVAEPANATEALELAFLCQQPYKRLHRTAVRLTADAFASEPKWADALPQRYNAACSAVLAARGDAADATLLPDRVVVALRRDALAWLRADLALCSRLLKSKDAPSPRLVQHLSHWQSDADLASARDKDALAKLPEDERQAWQKLWADVAALIERTSAAK